MLKSRGKNTKKSFLDAFELPEFETEVGLLKKNLVSFTLNLLILTVRNCI
jgi:hypothetical protein